MRRHPFAVVAACFLPAGWAAAQSITEISTPPGIPVSNTVLPTAVGGTRVAPGGGFVWTTTGGGVFLQPNGSGGTAVSFHGDWVAGNSNGAATRWHFPAGTAEGLGGANSEARGMNADGSVVVGDQ